MRPIYFGAYAREAARSSSQATSENEKQVLMGLACTWAQAALMSERVLGSSFILNPAVARCHLAATRWFFNLWVHRSGFTPLPSGAAERAVDAP